MDKTKKQNTPIAITGMGCLFPKSSGLKEYWRLISQGLDGITDIPETHWRPEDYYNEDPQKPDHVYCKRGGFLSPVSFDPTEFGIPPSSLEATDTSQLLGLVTAKMALEDAGYGDGRTFDKDKTSVILGVTGTQELVISLGARLGYPKWRKALEDSGIGPEKAKEVIEKISDSYVAWHETSFPGLLGNIVAGRISNRLDLGGTNCVVDAACASSLSAIHLAVMELQTGRSNIAVTGGVDTINDIFMHMCFSETRTLSPNGDARPFSKDADGTVLGEGIGIIVLKRLEMAEKDGDRIYAVIKAIGSSSDGKSQSIYAPNANGQQKALRRAYQSADIDPATIELIETHGTGTRVGDRVEFQSLKSFFGESSESYKNNHKCAIGSVKSMIGHTKAAAGSAGLIKTALALYNKVLPPTLKATEPDPDLGINKSRFYLNTQTRPWLSKKDHPRRAGVSAFGFGGSNFHIVLEEYRPQKEKISWNGFVEILALSAPSRPELTKRLHALKNAVGSDLSDQKFSFITKKSRQEFSYKDPHRLLLTIEMPPGEPFNPSGLIENALNTLESNKHENSWNLQNIFVGGPNKSDKSDKSGSDKPGKIAFIFPGQGSQYVNMGRDLVCTFPEALAALEKTNEKYKNHNRLSDFIYPIPAYTNEEKKNQEDTLRKTDIAQPALCAVSLSLLHILQRFGIQPDATCGHSFGELLALYAAGWIDADTLINLSIARGFFMAAAGKNPGATNGAMLAVKASLYELDTLIRDAALDVILANRNSPDQGVLSGAGPAIEEADKICRQKGFKTIRLPVSAAFHSRLVKDAQEPFLRFLTNIVIHPTEIPVFSNATAAPYPADPDAAKKLLGEQIVCPVNFAGEIENMFYSGIRTFVEVGPRAGLTGLVNSILEDRPFHTVAIDSSSGKRSGILDLAKTLCHLASIGHRVELDQWEDPVSEPKKQIMSISLSGANYRSQAPGARSQKTEVKKQAPAMIKGQTDNKSDKPISRLHNRDLQMTPIAENQEIMNKEKQQSEFILDALKTVQEGLKSMQALQMQTAQAHQKFLETQAEAGRILQGMMGKTQQLVKAAIGTETELNVLDCRSGPKVQNLEATIQSPVTTKENIFDSVITETSMDVPLAKPETETLNQDATLPNTSHNEIEPILLETVSRLTGYPQEMLALDMDIETDLGIDSIKRVEILSTLEEKMPNLPSIPPNILGALKTLGQIIEYLAGTMPLKPRAHQTAADSSIISDNDDLQEIAPESIPANIEKKVVSPIETLFEQGRQTSIPLKKKVVITEDQSGLAEAISDELASLNIDSLIVPCNAIPEIGKDKKGLPQIAGLIILADNNSINNDPPHRTAWNQQDDLFLKDAFALTRHVARDLLDSAKKSGAVFATITRMDGAFGFKGQELSNPLQGGLAGLAKTASIEWKNVCCHALDIAPDWQENKDIARAVVREIFNQDPAGHVEIGLAPGSRYTLKLESVPYPSALQTRTTLNQGDVVIITGGARGITASCALALAKHTKPTMVLLGRSPHPAPEPEWLIFLDETAAIKRAILENEFNGNVASPAQIEHAYQKYMANREIAKNLRQLQATGAEALYYPVDICDADAVLAIINDVRSVYGPIKGIIHGAGVLEDRLIIDKTQKQFEKVFNTKVRGLKILLEATKDDMLKHIVLFSSVTARTGNKGQVDYAMANEVLNKIAQQESIKQPGCRVISINWGPWDGGMVSGALKREFERKGIDLIPVDKGPVYMLHEMTGDKSWPVEVIINANSLSERVISQKQEELSLAFHSELDLDRYPILKSHILDGIPVVPFALMTEWLGHGALHANPGLFLHGLDDMRLLHGIKLDHGKKKVRLLAGKARKKGFLFEVDVEIRNGIKDGTEMIYTRARAILTDKFLKPPIFKQAEQIDTKPYSRSIDEVYEKILFHGKDLRGIDKIISCSPQGMTAQISPAPAPEQWLADPPRSRWIGDPLVLDSAFQMATVWCFEEKGVVSLPSYTASYRQYRNTFPSEGITAVLEVKEVADHKIKGDFTFLDRDNVVVARLTGYEAVMDASLFKAFKPQNNPPDP